MLSNLISLPIMLVLSVLQMTAISRINFLNGSADLILLAVAAWGIREKNNNAFIWALIGGLMVSVASAMPSFSPLVPYIFTALVARLFSKRLWQAPILALIITAISGTIFQHFFYIILLQLSGIPLDFAQSVSNVTLPSLLLNFFFLFPVYVIIGDIWKWVTPEEMYA
jgi:cell shape-determining protein MreD